MTEVNLIHDALTKLLPKFGTTFTNVEQIRRLSGGASQETWSFIVKGVDGSQRKILRRAPNGVYRQSDGQAIGLDIEASVIMAARDQDVNAPRIDHVCEPEDGLGSAYIMDHVEGETIARKILRDDAYATARDVLSAQCGENLAKIHGIALDTLPDLPETGAATQLDQYEAIYRSFEAPRPVFELALQWLRANAPSGGETCLVHGDFRLGNLMIDESGLAAVLDWELCHIGHPCEDVGWICVNSWRFGQSENRVGGFGDLAPLLDRYNELRGTAYTADDILYWEMLGSLKWGIMCMMMYSAFSTGADPSVERAAIGRRSSETEIDLLNLLETVR